MKLCIYCAGGSGKLAFDLAQKINKVNKVYDEIIFVDDVVQTDYTYGAKVFSFDEIKKYFNKNELRFVITIGEPKNRKLLYERVKSEGYKMGSIIDPEAKISETAEIGEGAIIAGAFIGSDTSIGANAFIYENAVIGHDITIGDNCNIAVGSFIAGHCNIGNCVYIGPMSSVRDRIKIEDFAVVAMGAAVYNNITEHFTAIGNPARMLPGNKDSKLF